MAVQFCGTCGHPLVPDQIFCQHCGSRAEPSTGSRPDENATRAAPPAAAGTPVSSGGALYCGECGALVGSQDRVCRRCGALVDPSPGSIVDASLSDVPTMMGTPPPPVYQPPAVGRGQQTPVPAYPAQPPPAWGAGYSSGPQYESPTFTFDAQRPGAAPPYARPGEQTPPYRPDGPGGPPPRRRQRWPLVLATVLVALALIVGGSLFLILHGTGGNPQANGSTPTPAPGITQTPGGNTVTPSPTQVVLTPDTASALIEQFYADINAKNYDAAYDLLSPEYQQTQSRQSFDSGFQNTLHDTITITNTEPQSSNTIKVDVTLQAQETSGVSNFAGYYIVTKENGQLLILSGHLTKQ